ncbi:nucleoside-diphosphate kinase [Candidatus Woesearchaeota archaeon]|nr:nucleoside-diphosphate kinase [Candidatus Woesearchaeota archaeon]
MIEKSLIILKADVVARGFIGKIVSRFEKVGLKIVAMKMMKVPKNMAETHYKKDDTWLMSVGTKLIKNQNLNANKEDPMKHGQRICDTLAHDLTIYPVVAMVLEGHNTINLVRKMIGEQSPENSAPGTIRGDYSFDTYVLANAYNRPVITLVHASDSKKTAEKEIKLWFKKDELVEWKNPHEDLHFRKQKK